MCCIDQLRAHLVGLVRVGVVTDGEAVVLMLPQAQCEGQTSPGWPRPRSWPPPPSPGPVDDEDRGRRDVEHQVVEVDVNPRPIGVSASPCWLAAGWTNEKRLSGHVIKIDQSEASISIITWGIWARLCFLNAGLHVWPRSRSAVRTNDILSVCC